MITDNLKTILFKAIGWTEGKGPVGCVVFNNGDFGCFQLNMMHISAPAYIQGTGKDKDGNPIDRSPSMPNGGEIDTYVDPACQDGRVAYYIGGSTYWLICGKSSTTKVCYIETP